MEEHSLSADSALSGGPSEELVIGGRDEDRPIPFQVSLQRYLPDLKKYSHFGGGVIIDEYVVLTAAHCVKDVTNIHTYHVVAGITRLQGRSDHEQRRTIEDLIFCDDYRRNDLEEHRDIAMIRLKQPFQFNAYVNKAKLPERDVYPEGRARVSGWGLTSKSAGEVSQSLQSSPPLHVCSLRECEQLFGCAAFESRGLRTQLRRSRRIAGDRLCSVHEESMPWRGDSGGPLVQDGIVIGIVAVGASLTKIAQYMRVSAFLNWINDGIKSSRASSASPRDGSSTKDAPGWASNSWLYLH